jgi:hypothetical protein
VKAELEGLILAREALLEARSGEEARRARNHYQSLLDKVLERCPNLPHKSLELMIERAHSRWCKAQEKPGSIPPRA